MQFSQPIPVQELASRFQAQLCGDDQLVATGINELHHVVAGDICFVDHPKYYDKVLQSAATIIIIDKEVEVPAGKAILVHPQPFDVFNELVWAQRPFEPLQQAISEHAHIGGGTIIEPGAYIGHHVHIGQACYIQAGAYIGDYSVLGNAVTVQAGAVIGTEAFYYKKTASGFTKWRSGGRVVLEDSVDIGPNCTINKGVSSDTLIGVGSKLDSQVQIGHDTKVGKNCLFAAQVGIAGNCHIGDEVVLYGQVGVAQNLTIGDRAVVLAKSGVSKNLAGGKTYFGYPAQEMRTAYKELAALRNLPDFMRKS